MYFSVDLLTIIVFAKITSYKPGTAIIHSAIWKSWAVHQLFVLTCLLTKYAIVYCSSVVSVVQLCSVPTLCLFEAVKCTTRVTVQFIA